MMSVTIHEVLNKKELISFIKYPFKLYKGNKYYVPPIIDFELSALDKNKNPAFENCKARYFIAKSGDQIVGRIAAIILDEEKKEKNLMRFGWIDFDDDPEITDALFDTIIQWGEEEGITGIHGPLGFTDLDFEGALIDGFEELATQATIYNYPYYKEHFERIGFEKACDWIEMRGKVPAKPRRMERASSIIKSRFKLQPVVFKKTKDILKYAPGVFEVLNLAFKNLYGYYKLTDKQIQYFIDQYFGFVRKEFINIIVNEKDEVVAFAVSLPSLSGAFQKAKGYLYPFGFIHVLKAFRSNDLLDMLLIGVHPDYQKLGASQLIFSELLQTCIKKGVKKVNTACMLEENSKVLNLWNEYENDIHTTIRRRCFIKKIK